MTKCKAAVVGLGNIGFRFNLDPKRQGTWSHVAAYEKAAKTELAGVVEIDDEKIEDFRRLYGEVPVFGSVQEMMDKIDVDIVSVCTPPDSHYPLLKELAAFPVKAVFCEKPIALNVKEAEELVRIYQDKEIVLAVNHIRRWEESYLQVQRMVMEGKIGSVRAVHAFYPAQIFNIGTHLLDVIRMLIQKDPVAVSGFSSNLQNNDPDVSGLIIFSDGVPCTIVSTGKREDLIFEIDIIGDEGRIRITENGDKIECFAFTASDRYSGYRELSPVQTEPVPAGDRFVESINDIVRAVEEKGHSVSCSGEDGLYSLVLSFRMLESAQFQGVRLRINDLADDLYVHGREKEKNAKVGTV